MSRAVPVADLPSTTGNGLAVVSDRVLRLDRDLRDSAGSRWYWHIRLRGSGTVRVQMARPDLLGGFGPCVRRSDLHGYEWLYESYDVRDTFDIELGALPSTVLLAPTQPYGRDRWRAFVGGTSSDGVERVRIGTSEAGRPVEMFHVKPSGAVRRRMVLAARHHACETVGSLLLEAIIRSYMDLRRQGVGWVRNTELLAVPLVDVDGVERGDQGKGRLPHDHNRDYGRESRYASVRAIRRAGLLDEVPTAVLDLHTPGLLGPLEERPFLVASGDRGDVDLITAFAAAVAGGPAARPEVMVFDEDWNSAGTRGIRCFAAWARSHRNLVLSASVEYPNAVVRGVPVSSAAVRHFGERLVEALGQVLHQ